MDEISQLQIEAVKALTDKELTGLFHLLHDHDFEFVKIKVRASQLYLHSTAIQYIIDWALAGSVAPRLNQLSTRVHSEYWRRQFI